MASRTGSGARRPALSGPSRHDAGKAVPSTSAAQLPLRSRGVPEAGTPRPAASCASAIPGHLRSIRAARPGGFSTGTHPAMQPSPPSSSTALGSLGGYQSRPRTSTRSWRSATARSSAAPEPYPRPGEDPDLTNGGRDAARDFHQVRNGQFGSWSGSSPSPAHLPQRAVGVPGGPGPGCCGAAAARSRT